MAANIARWLRRLAMVLLSRLHGGEPLKKTKNPNDYKLLKIILLKKHCFGVVVQPNDLMRNLFDHFLNGLDCAIHDFGVHTDFYQGVTELLVAQPLLDADEGVG